MPPLRVATWNVNGLDPADLDIRSEAQCLALLLREDQPQVVMLQELVRRSWHAHFKHHFAAAGFVAVPTDPPAATTSEYFCAILVKRDLPIRRHGAERFPNTQMGRHLVWAEVGWQGQDLLVSTSHLESTKPASLQRIAQLSAVVAGLRGHQGPAVFGGDTNLRKAEEPSVEGLSEVTDAWVDLGSPAEQRATWPSTPRGGRPGARFDRMLAHGITVVGFRLIGSTAPGMPFPPSDHLGVEVLLEPLR